MVAFGLLGTAGFLAGLVRFHRGAEGVADIGEGLSDAGTDRAGTRDLLELLLHPGELFAGEGAQRLDGLLPASE